MKIFFLGIILLFSAQTLVGEFDTVYVRKWLVVANKFQKNERYDSAIFIIKDKIIPKLKLNSKPYLEALIYLSNYYLSNKDTSNFKYYAHYIDSVAARSGYTDTRARILSNLGTIANEQGDFSQSILYFKKSIQLFQETGDSLSLALVKQYLVNPYLELNDFNGAINIYMDAWDIYKRLQYRNGEAGIYGGLGILYRRMKDYPNSIKSYRKAILILKDLRDKESLASIYLDLGVAYLSSAILDSANEYISKSYEILKNMPIDKSTGVVFENWGEVSYKLHKYKLAEQQLSRGMEIYRKSGYKKGIINIRIWQAEVLLATGHIEEAKAKLNQSFIELRKHPFTGSMRMALNALKDIQLAEKDYRAAFHTVEKILAFSDSLYEVQKAEAVLKAKILYDTKHIQEKNKQLQAENYTHELKISNLRKQIFIYILFIAILLVISLWYVYHAKQKKRQLVLEKESETLRLIRNEKDKISMELHDLIGGEIFGMLLQYQILGDIINDSRLGKLNLAFGKVYEKVRGYSRTLKNIDARNLPLEISILNLTHRFEAGSKVRIQTNVASFDWQELASNTKEHIYHIIQESIINAMKYSRADIIEIIFDKKKKVFRFKVKDNGQGFDLQKVENSNGLKNIRERVEKIGGSLSIKTEEGKGTIILVIVENNPDRIVI